MKKFALIFLVTVFSCHYPKPEFAPPIDISSGTVSGVSSMAACDINLDGYSDIVGIEGGKHGSKKTFAWFQAPKDADILVFQNPLPEGKATEPWPYYFAGKGLPWHHINDLDIVGQNTYEGKSKPYFYGSLLF